jgi:hypothetical protein
LDPPDLWRRFPLPIDVFLYLEDSGVEVLLSEGPLRDPVGGEGAVEEDEELELVPRVLNG